MTVLGHTWLKTLLPAIVWCFTQTAHGNAIYDVTLDTSGLIGHPAAPFYLEFQFNDGIGTGDANNTATLSNFLFDTGSAAGSATLTGDASGDLTSAVTLTDSSFFNEMYQQFIPGNTLSFRVDLTTQVDPGPQPDQFSFAILDCNLIELPTQGAGDALLRADVNGAAPFMEAYAADLSRAPSCGGAPIWIPAASVQPVPLPGSLALFITGGLLIVRAALPHRASRKSVSANASAGIRIA